MRVRYSLLLLKETKGVLSFGKYVHSSINTPLSVGFHVSVND